MRKAASRTERHFVVVGGGPAGLAAALCVERSGGRATVLERGPSPGGRSGFHIVQTKDDTWRFDMGAEFVASFYDRTLRLVRELGSIRLLPVPFEGDLVIDGRAQPVPLKIGEVLRTPLLSWRTKRRVLGLALRVFGWRKRLGWGVLERAAELDYESAADWFTREVGPDYVNLTLRATLDTLTLSPAEETSCVIALSEMREAVGARIYCPSEGMGAIWQAAADRIDFRPGATVTSVRRSARGATVELADGHTIEADGVIVAVPARDALKMIDDACPERAIAQDARYAPAVKLHVCLERPLAQARPICPAGPGPHALAGIGIVDAKPTSQIPMGRGGLSIVASRTLGASLLEASDDTVADRLFAEAEKLLSRRIDGVLARSVVRLDEAVPIFRVGWLRRLASLRAQLAPTPIALAGDYLASPSVEGAVRSGEIAATRVLAWSGSALPRRFHPSPRAERSDARRSRRAVM